MAAVRRESTVTVRQGGNVDGLTFTPGRPHRVTGVRVGTGTCPRDPAVFEACAARLGLAAEPLSPVLAMAGLDNRWTALTDDAGPVVTGLVNTGDSLIHTNPTLGHGVALGLRTAQHLAAHADTVADPAGDHAWTVRELRPVFDAQVTGDRTVGERLAEGAPPSDHRAAALAACAFDDPVVMRARAQVRHLVHPPAEAYGTDEVERHLTAWLTAHPEFTPGHDGPSRAEWEAVVAAPPPYAVEPSASSG